ncbi:hypothetical protein BDD12DRAFT_191184 [Trichophaea hybrida]|nr:hypothetical protein BDD12DRAFT_191184 [Trichophaea hybrida]
MRILSNHPSHAWFMQPHFRNLRTMIHTALLSARSCLTCDSFPIYPDRQAIVDIILSRWECKEEIPRTQAQKLDPRHLELVGKWRHHEPYR